jgi:2-iminobutanoate/2-iminopropanoate deaminase
MSEKVSIFAEEAPAPFGHYCNAIKFGSGIHLSGQLPLDPKTGRPIQGDAEAQARQVLDNMTAILQACGCQMSNVLKTTLYLTDLRDFPIFDKVSKDYFFFLPPARTTVAVAALPGGCRICLDGYAEIRTGAEPGKKMI